MWLLNKNCYKRLKVNQIIICILIFFKCFRCLNEEKFSELMENRVLCKSKQIINYKLDDIVIVLNNISLKSATVNTFCKQFNIKLIQNVLYVDYYLYLIF